jgi:hypothetical protein
MLALDGLDGLVGPGTLTVKTFLFDQNRDNVV